MRPTFTWQPPNIRAVPGAVWLHRDRIPNGEWSEPVARTDVPKKRIVSTLGDDGPMAAEFRFPPAHGDAFYRTLQKLGYKLVKMSVTDIGEYR